MSHVFLSGIKFISGEDNNNNNIIMFKKYLIDHPCVLNSDTQDSVNPLLGIIQEILSEKKLNKGEKITMLHSLQDSCAKKGNLNDFNKFLKKALSRCNNNFCETYNNIRPKLVNFIYNPIKNKINSAGNGASIHKKYLNNDMTSLICSFFSRLPNRSLKNSNVVPVTSNERVHTVL